MNITKRAVFAVTAAGIAAGASAGAAVAHSTSEGVATKSPGVLSGNVVQAPIHVPINFVGNSGNLFGLLNPAFGNKGTNN